MKLVYISPLRYPSEKAGSLFSVKSCEAFSKLGLEVELWAPVRRNRLAHKNTFEYFGVNENFKIRRFFAIDLIDIIPFSFHLLAYSFAFSVFLYTLFLKISRGINRYIFYSHEQFVILPLTFLSNKTFYEMHDFPGKQFMYKILFRRIHGVVSTNTWKTEAIIKNFNIKKKSILTIPNAVDVEHFSHNLSTKEAKQILKLPEKSHLIGYIGSLKTMNMEKGVATSIDSLKFLGEDYTLYIVGGEQHDILYYKKYAEEKGLVHRVVFVGKVSYKEIPLYSAVCDCLIAPYPDIEHYSHYMSPMKIFEYMASKRPIVATSLPSLKEVLVEGETAILVPPSDPQALARAIERLTTDISLARKLAETAYNEVKEKYTWHKRAGAIIDFIKKA